MMKSLIRLNPKKIQTKTSNARGAEKGGRFLVALVLVSFALFLENAL